MADLLARLDAANGVIAGADASMASAEAAVAAAREDQRRAEEAAAAARAKAAAAREEVAELQVRLWGRRVLVAKRQRRQIRLSCHCSVLCLPNLASAPSLTPFLPWCTVQVRPAAAAG